MHRLTLPLLTVVLMLLTLSAAPVQAQSSCGYPELNAEGAIALTGEGQLNTRLFDLEARPYTVRWSFQPAQKIVAGNTILYVKRPDGAIANGLLLNSTMSKGDPETKGETQLYLTKAGAHYLEVHAPASWSVTIAPQS